MLRSENVVNYSYKLKSDIYKIKQYTHLTFACTGFCHWFKISSVCLFIISFLLPPPTAQMWYIDITLQKSWSILLKLIYMLQC